MSEHLASDRTFKSGQSRERANHSGNAIFGGWDQLDLAAVQRLRERLDRPWSVPLLLGSRLTPALDADVAAYVSILGALYRAIAEVTGARVIVDSSKIATFAMLLRQVPGLEVRTAHLVRDPRGVVHSWRKSVVRADGGRRDAMLRYGVASASVRYVAYNALAHGLALRGRYRFLRYEDLLADPRATVARLLAFAGVLRLRTISRFCATTRPTFGRTTPSTATRCVAAGPGAAPARHRLAGKPARRPIAGWCRP